MDKKYKTVKGIPFSMQSETTKVIEVDGMFIPINVEVVEITTMTVEVYSADKKKVLDKQSASSKLQGELGKIEALTRALSLTELPDKKDIVRNYIQTCLV